MKVTTEQIKLVKSFAKKLVENFTTEDMEVFLKECIKFNNFLDKFEGRDFSKTKTNLKFYITNTQKNLEKVIVTVDKILK